MISVVIPLYNKAQSIRSTLDSVLAQTYSDWECVIVDDGSTDGSAEVCEEFVHSLNPSCVHSFRIIHQPNAGVSAARNTGILAAKGEYIAFLDADDLWAPTYLAELASLIADFPDAVLYGLGYGWIRDGKRISREGKSYRGVIKIDGIWLMRYNSSTSCIPKYIVQKVGMFNETLTHGEDLDMWWRLMLNGEAVFDNSKEYAYYILDAENRAMDEMPPINKHVVSIIDQYAVPRENNVDFRKIFDTQMIYFLYEYLFTPYKNEAKRLAHKLDYSQLKHSLRFRIEYPHLYRLMRWIQKKLQILQS